MKRLILCWSLLFVFLSLFPWLPQAATIKIAIGNFFFAPQTVTINVGDTIIWENQGSTFHTSTSGQNCTPDGKWHSGFLAPSDSFTMVFEEPGTFPYFCDVGLHCEQLDMKGTIVVNEAPVVLKIKVEPIVTGLANPVAITHSGDGLGRLFIVLQTGQILVYDGTQVLPVPFLDISSLVSTGGERGLLSVAFHPNYAANGLFYVNYTDKQGDTVIAQYAVSDDPNIAASDSAVILLTIAQPFSNHNGGELQFGPDGYLYIGMGDGGSAGDPQNNAQNLGTLLGKMLRIDVNNGVPYTIPPDNPFVGDPEARDEIWALGLRNPWRFSFDRLTGDLFIADVGQNDWEEVDFQPANSPGGENYGWRLMEGNHCFNPPTDCNDGTLTLPILEYDHSLGCSITGGYRYRGTQIPQLEGTYIFGDFCSGRIWGAKEDSSGGWSTIELLDTDFLITAFGEDEAGEIYFIHYDPSDGAIYRIVELPNVSVNLAPDSDIVPRGGTLGFQATVTNNIDEAQVVLFATNVTLPNGSIFPPLGFLFGPIVVRLGPNQSKSGHLSHTIPLSAPLGAYTYHGLVGQVGVGVIDEDQFDFEVTEAPAVLGSRDWETTVDRNFPE